MSKLIDLTGQRFGRLVVISRAEDICVSTNNRRKIAWRCLCDCGTLAVIAGESLRTKDTKSCGCLHRECASNLKRSHSLCKAGNGKQHRLYNIWVAMRQRCNNPNSEDYKNYGARGIRVCGEWDDYKEFHDWALTHGYQDNLTIERLNFNGCYEPLNCTWIPKAEQSKNIRTCKYIEFQGERKLMKQWAKDLGLSYPALKDRLGKLGWSIERALTTPTGGIR